MRELMELSSLAFHHTPAISFNRWTELFTGPLKRSYNNECAKWMLNNPGRTITIHDIGNLLGYAHPKAVTPSNIMSGFRVTGISAYSPDVFFEDNFMASAVTNHEAPTAEGVEESTSAAQATPLPPNLSQSTTVSTAKPTSSETSRPVPQPKPCSSLTPEQVRPFAKAGPRKRIRRTRVKSIVILGSPAKQPKIGNRLSKRKLSPSPDTSDDEETNIPLAMPIDDVSECESEQSDRNINLENIDVGDYILVKHARKRTFPHYVGVVEEHDIDINVSKVKFLKSQAGSCYFTSSEETCHVDDNQIVMVLRD